MAAHTHDLYATTVEEIERSPARVRSADTLFSHLILSTMVLALLTALFWLVYNGRVERERLEAKQVLAVVSAEGRVAMTPAAQFRTGPEDVEIWKMAGEQVELIDGAGTGDYATRFGYARERFTAAARADFDAGAGSQEVEEAFARAKAEGREFYRRVQCTMRPLTPEDMTGVRFPARLEYQQILPRFDVLVEGHVETYAAGNAERVDVKKIVYWVRLAELERRTLKYPHALLVEHMQPLKLSPPKATPEPTKEVQP